MAIEFSHEPVMLKEVLEGLSIRPEGVYLDGTLGGGGHAFHVCAALCGNGRFIGIDQDDEAIAAAGERLRQYGERVTIRRSNYRDFDRVLDELSIDKVDGILLDLGVSSHQLDDPERGFTYREDVPLDMRMDRRQALTARDVVNGYEAAELKRILYTYGEERFADAIVKGIIRARQTKPVETTGELVDIVRAAIPAKFRGPGTGHPAKQTFQAIRIEVNRELAVLEDSIDRMIDRLTPGGRLCIITFHSLEDRTVKQRMKTAENPCTCPPGFPVCICGKKPKGKVITRKPVTASEEEILRNSRAKSAKLRVFEKA